MEKDLLTDKITPADGEMSVRTYYCTYYQSRLLGLEASGYLGVTNKRVIFQAYGKSNAGPSVIQSELPIADVSGISSYKGTYFSFGHLIGAFFVSIIASGVITAILGIAGAIEYQALQVLGWVLGIGGFLLTFGFPRHAIWKPIFAATSSTAFASISGGSLLRSFSLLSGFNSGSAETALGFFLAFIAGIYTLLCFFWYARRPTFSLAVNSKGGSSTPINISGASGIGIFDVSAGRALTAEPAEEAEIMLQELGAVILDVQTLGDLGIKKWKKS